MERQNTAHMKPFKHEITRNARRWGAAGAAALIFAGVGGVTLAPLTTPAAHAQRISLVSKAQEMDAGEQASREVESKYRVVTGTREARLVEQIGRRMAAVSGRTDVPYRFRVIDEPAVNAFSIPGYVYVHTGLIRATGNDTDALAGVIAHEVAHIAAKHSKEHMEKSSVAGLLGGLLTRGNRNTSAVFGIAANGILLKHGRDDEYEADRLAVRYMKQTGYDPQGMVRFFSKLQQAEGKDNKLTAFFRTHPASGDRIKRIQQEINQ